MIIVRKSIFCLTIILICALTQKAYAQKFYDFEDPATFEEYGFIGDTSLYLIQNGLLNLNASGANSPATIFLESDAVTNASWQFHIELDFNPSSSNFAEVYLLGKLDSSLNFSEGYYLQIGGTSDDLKLFKKENGHSALLIDGQDKVLDLSNILIDIKVNRDSVGHWELFTKFDSESEFNLAGIATDNSILTSSYWGLSCNFTSTRSDKFRFDNVFIDGIPYPDIFPPKIDTIFISGPKELIVAFNEKTLLSPNSFSIIKPLNISANSLQLLLENTYSIQFEHKFLNGYSHTLLVQDISDESFNVMSSDTIKFTFFEYSKPGYKDIVINEVFPDPTPPEDLPDAEFIELWNRSLKPQNLHGWKLSDNRSEAFLDHYILLPDSLLILTSKSNESKFLEFGKVLSVNNWPSLNNDSDILVLKDSTDTIIDSLHYKKSSHTLDKTEGGWSLELINPDNPCNLPTNWTSSINEIGGSPGKINSVYNPFPDTIPPSIIKVSAIDQYQTIVKFSEPVIPVESSIFINSLPVESWNYGDEYLMDLVISNSNPLESMIEYEFYFEQISDCFNNQMISTYIILNFDFDTPQIDSIYSIFHNQIDILFDEDIDISDLIVHIPDIQSNIQIEQEVINKKHLTLLLDTMLIQPSSLTLQIFNLSDTKGNLIPEKEISINYNPPDIPEFHDLVISEFLPDPVPSAGLPEFEFIEIQNTSTKSFPLRGITIQDLNKGGVVLDGRINPGDYYILCPESATDFFEDLGNVAGVSNWPQLNSTNDSIILLNQNGEKIFNIGYSKNWYANDEKADGGWSLELINNRMLCLGDLAWAESQSLDGGTPGQANSFSELTQEAAVLVSWSIVGTDTVLLNFDRRMDVNTLEEASVTVHSQLIGGHFFKLDSSDYNIGLKTMQRLASDSVQTMHISGLKDCSGRETQVFIEYVLDVSTPEIIKYDFRYSNRMELLFSEKIDIENVRVLLNNKPLDSVQLIFPFVERKDTLSLLFTSLESHTEQKLQLTGLSDLAGNQSDLSLVFIYEPPYVASTHDLIITEIMATPSDEMEIDFEFVEIYNPTQYAIPLFNYALNDLNTTGFLGYDFIEPYSYAVLVPESYDKGLSGNFLPVYVKPWPQLNKSSDMVALKNNRGDIVHKVEYEDSWYQSVLKNEGGWSLEMIDTSNPCGEINNWIVSESIDGGTPGKINSVHASKPDLRGPEVLSVYIKSKDSIEIILNEKLSIHSVHKENFKTHPSLYIQDVQLSASEKIIYIKLADSIIRSVPYELIIDGITDCNGNIIPESQKKVSILYPETPQITDIVINEILFNPRSEGTDFIELYNTSNKYLKLDGSKISNNNDTLEIGTQLVLYPYSYMVLTSEPERVLNEYPNTRSETIFSQKLPSMPDNEGLVRFMNAANNVLDEIFYSNDMHFDLYTDIEGISLERISPEEPSNNISNWTSASSLSDGATPGYKNSQFLVLSPIENPLSISPQIFDPNSGNAHFTTIQFAFDKPGYVATLSIYDLQGRLVTKLFDIDYLPQSGFVNWEGTNDNGAKVPSAPYIIFFRVFDLEGRVKTYRERVVIGTRF